MKQARNVDGLDHHERITLLENAVSKLWKAHEEMRREVADLRLDANRRRIWWPLRFFLRRKEADDAE